MGEEEGGKAGGREGTGDPQTRTGLWARGPVVKGLNTTFSICGFILYIKRAIKGFQ